MDDDSRHEYRNSNGLMLASRNTIKESQIPLGQLKVSDVILENDEYQITSESPQPTERSRSKTWNHCETMIMVKKNGSNFAQERKNSIVDYLHNPENVPIGISQVKLKCERKQMIQLAFKKRLENHLIFR